MDRIIQSPGKYIQGADVINRLGEYLKPLAERWLVVGDKFVLGFAQSTVEKSFKDAGLVVEIAPFGGECSQNEIDRLRGIAETAQCGAILGIGGGKTLDTAKALAHFMGVPVAIAPTIASTDAPCSALSVIYTDDGEFDRYLMLPNNPNMVIVDTKIVAGAPARLLAAGIGDALATWFEARACSRSGATTMAGGKCTQAALALAELCYNTLLEELESYLSSGQEAKASQLYYNKVSVCGGYLSQYTMQLLKASILDAQTTYTEISELGERIALMQIVVVALCVALGCASGLMVMQLLTPVSQMIEASRAISRSQFDTPDIPLPKQPEIGQLAESFNRMKHSMAQQVSTLQEKNEIERELHRQKTEALELQNRMERSRLQQLRSQIDPHFLFNTLNVIQQMAGTESAYRTQALIMALSHLLRYSLMSNDEQVPLSREVRVVDEYYSIYHVRFGDRVQMEWAFSDSLDLTETMVPSFILQPIVENAFKHGICPKEEGGVVRIRMIPLREKGLLCIRVLDNGVGIEPEQLEQLRMALEQPAPRWEHIGIYNVAARLRLLDARCRVVVRSRPGRGTAVILYLPLVENEEEFEE